MVVRRSALACVLVAACRGNDAVPHEADGAARVVDARRDAPDEGTVVSISVPFACELRAVQVARGDHVTRGQRLALVVGLDSTSSPLHHALANRIAAEHAHARLKQLHALGEVSMQELENAEEELRAATAELARQRALAAFAFDAAAESLSDEVASRYFEIVRAPVDGIILSVPTTCEGALFTLTSSGAR